MNPDELNQLSSSLERYSSGVILLPVNPSEDAIAAASALYLGLARAGKNVGMTCETPVKSEYVGADKISTDVVTSGDNLVITFPYTEGSVDKVDYNITGDKFNLIVSPRQGSPKLEQNDVRFSHAGGVVEFVITIDTPSPKNLGTIYKDHQDLFANKFVVNIDRHLSNSYYGQANIVDKSASSLSEIVFGLLSTLGVELDQDIASNLLGGLSAATNNFSSYSVSPTTFEIAASLMKLGGKRKRAQKQAPEGQLAQIPRPSQSFTPANMQQLRQQQKQQVEASRLKNPRPVEYVEQDVADQEEGEDEDWLKPKIFKPRSGGDNLS